MRLWNDCEGGVFTTELLLITSVIAAGVTTGLANYRNAIHDELTDLASSVQSINQSFAFTGVRSRSAHTAGSAFADYLDSEMLPMPLCTTVDEFE